MYNSPFSSLKIDNFENFVYMFHAPIITEFLKFVIDSQAENLLFLAREGYYFTKLYKKYCSLNKINLQNNYYFLASRKATNTASINNEDDILAILKNGKFRELGLSSLADRQRRQRRQRRKDI